jgi:hypothetical protein
LEERSRGTTAEARDALGKMLDEWHADPDLACVRRPVALAKLPDPEREAWRAFWAKVDALRATARGATP